MATTEKTAPFRLSKSRYQLGLQCPRALWLRTHRPEVADATTVGTQHRFNVGHEVGILAQGLFPGGTEITEDHLHSAEALATTKALLAGGARTLYEPAFEHDGVLVRVDILTRADDGSDAWDLYEVKSSSKLKPEHETDATVQTWVVEGAGLRVRRSNIVHLDTSYVWEGGDYDLRRLFAVEDVTESVRELLPGVPGLVASMRKMLAGDIPDTRLGVRCGKPYACPFFGWCHGERLPDDHPVTEVPYLGEAALHRLLSMGATRVADVPDACTFLSVRQRTAVSVIKSGEPRVSAKGLRRELAKLHYPVYHLDFETVMPALPLWPGTHPYELVPFQYSLHVEREDGTVEHREYLHTGPGDPRRPLAERLLADLDAAGSVTHYTPYECRVLDTLAAGLPDLAPAIRALHERMVDLEPIVKACMEHPDACGRTSIKYVLPAWCDDVSYGGLEIQDGETASVRYLEAIGGELDKADREAVFADLTAYCGTDTLAMVRLLQTMRELAGGA